jgi:hypothetical protein
MSKFCIYSAALINQIKYDFGKNLSIKNTEFLNNGKGNLIFSNVSSEIFDILENMQMIILLHDLILMNRKSQFIDKLNFYLCLPISQDQFVNFSEELNSYFLDLLEERKIKIYWNCKIKEIKSNNIIKFQMGKDVGNKISMPNEKEKDDSCLREENESKNENFKHMEMEYNFAYVFPKLVLPSFIRYSPLYEGKNKIEYDSRKLSIIDFENIYLMGDALTENSFLDRFYPNIIRQAEIISNNLKGSHFRLGKSHLKEYYPTNKIFLDFNMKNYFLFDLSTGNHELLKKNKWNNFLFKHLYFRPEGFYAQRILLKRKFE